MNKSAYLLELLVWAKSKDAQKKSPRHKPKPYVPEFMQKPVDSSPINKGVKQHSTDDIKAILAKPRVNK